MPTPRREGGAVPRPIYDTCRHCKRRLEQCACKYIDELESLRERYEAGVGGIVDLVQCGASVLAAAFLAAPDDIEGMIETIRAHTR